MQLNVTLLVTQLPTNFDALLQKMLGEVRCVCTRGLRGVVKLCSIWSCESCALLQKWLGEAQCVYNEFLWNCESCTLLHKWLRGLCEVMKVARGSRNCWGRYGAGAGAHGGIVNVTRCMAEGTSELVRLLCPIRIHFGSQVLTCQPSPPLAPTHSPTPPYTHTLHYLQVRESRSVNEGTA